MRKGLRQITTGLSEPSTTAPKKERSHSFHGKADRKSSKQLRRQVRHGAEKRSSVDGLLDMDVHEAADPVDCVRSGARSILLDEDNLINLENHARQRRESSAGPDLILDLPSR